MMGILGRPHRHLAQREGRLREPPAGVTSGPRLEAAGLLCCDVVLPLLAVRPGIDEERASSVATNAP